MKKLVGKFLTLGLSIAMLFGLISLSPAQGPTAVDVAAAENGYYSSITADSGTQLLGQLHDLITNHTKMYSSYDDSRDYATQTDPGLDGKGVMDFYTHETLTTFVGSSGGSGTWNREHVWPQANSNNLWGKSGGGADLHHIRPAEKDLNNSRGNMKYGDATGGSAVYSKKSGGGNSQIGGYTKNGVFMPSEQSRGDAARIVMYMYTHYNTYSSSIFGGYAKNNGNGNADYFGNIPITNIMSGSETTAFETLLEWNEEDPVDQIEIKRNEVVYGLQGNRNPFIDHPEYASAIWGDGSYTPNPDSGSGSGGTTDPGTTPGGSTSGETGKITITLDSFTMHDGYDFQDWSAGGVSGVAYVYGGNVNYPDSPVTDLQFSKPQDGRSYYLTNTTAIPGPITSITAKSAQYSNNWTVMTSDTSFGEVVGKPTGGTSHGQKAVPTSGATWNISGDDTYFAITYDTTEYAGHLASIEVTYATDEPVTPPTDDSEAKIQAALATLSSTKTISTTGTTTLAASSGDVSFQWSTDTSLPEGISFSGNTLTVSKLPANDTAIVFTVTASLNGKTGSKTVTVTVKGTGGGTVTPPTPGETKTIKITFDSFTKSDYYGFKPWTAGGVSGTAYIYGGNSAHPEYGEVTYLQFNGGESSRYLASTTAVPGVITSVTVTGSNKGTARDWKLLTSDSAYGEVAGKPTNGTDQGNKTVPLGDSVTWTVSDPNAKYFALTLEASKGAAYLDSIEITYTSNGQTVDPDPDPDPDTHMQALADALKPFEDHAKWNFAVTELDTGDEGTYHDYYEYLGYNLLNRYTVNGNDDNDENDKTYTDYLAYDAATGKSTFYADMGDGTYEAYAAGTDEYEDAISYIYSIDPSALKDYSFTYANGKYSAQNPAAVGNAVIGEYGYYDDDDTWIPSVWTSFDIYLGSDGKVSKIVAVQDGQTMEYTFSKYGSVNFTLPEVGGTDPVDPPAVTGITVSPATLSLTVGDTKNTTYFTVKAQPADAELGTVTFTTTDTNIIKIENGVITALAAGSATIKVSASGFEATISVTVTAASTPVDPEKNDGTAAKPYTVEEALALGANLGDNEYYKVDGVEKEIYVKGYVTDVGTIFREYGLSSVVIADEKGGTTTLLLYTVNWGEAMATPNPIPSDSPLQVGDYIVIHGFLKYFYDNKTQEGKLEIDKKDTTYPMLSTWQRDGKDVGTTTPVDPEPDTHEQDLAAVQAALAEVTDKTIEEAGTTTFPATSGDVALAWALATTEELPEGITFANGKLTVTALPETETTIRLTVTAALNDAEESKTITVTVKAAEKTDPDPVDPVDPDPDKPDPDEPDKPDPDEPDKPVDPDPDEPDPDEPVNPDPDTPGSDTPSTPGSSDTPSTPGDSGDTPSTPENPDEGEAPSQPAEEKKGCGGEIGGAVFAIVAIIMAAALVIVVVEKKRQ